MRNVTVFLSVVISFFFFSCSVSKNLGKDVTLPKTILSTEAIKTFDLMPRVTSLGVQFYTDTLEEIRLEPLKNQKNFSSLMPDGSLALGTELVDPVVFKSGTPGIIITPGNIILDKVAKKIKVLKVSFDKKNPNLFLAFGPSKDEAGYFVLLPDQEGNITYGGVDYQITSGKFSNLYFSYIYLEGQPSEYIVPGMEVVPKK